MAQESASAEAEEVERLLADLANLRLDPHRVSLRYRFGLGCIAAALDHDGSTRLQAIVNG